MKKQAPVPVKEIVYAAAMATGGFAGVVCVAMLDSASLPSVGVIIGFALFTVLTLLMEFPVGTGFIGLDRVSQIALILIFDPVTAAIVSVVTYTLWPFLRWREPGYSFLSAIVRAVHAMGMMAFVVLAGGGVYYALGGTAPLTQLDGPTIGALIAMAAVMQIINVGLMGVFAWVRGQTFRRALSIFGNLMELGMLPLAVLTAIVYNVLPLSSFLLLILVLLLLATLMRSFALNRNHLEKRVGQMKAVGRMSQAVNASIRLEALAELTYNQCRELLKFSAFHFVLYDTVAGELDFVLHHSRGQRMPRRRAPAGEGLLGWVIEKNEAVLIENWEKDSRPFRQRMVIIGDTPASWLGVPVTYRDQVLGSISVQSFVANTLHKSDLDLMMALAGQVGAAIANARLYGELEEYKRDLERKVDERTESLRKATEAKEQLLVELQRKTDALDRLSKEDSLTGLFNRRFMDECLASEMRRAERFKHDVAIAMADIDHFKQINDSFSHSIGDDVLRITGRILRDACRSIDIVSRYGGEEFVICFPETNLAGAMEVCERVRRMMSDYNWEFVAAGLKVTLSIGVAGGFCYDQEVLQKEADRKLYAAKEAGRDRVCA
ncbi:MAG TPA: sensor domain-containing diguanylate cyclase [Gammaproteobacteria bacterium]|nr:sensor domain-containing diguanylate cyclase [Gammaproteobacteria bacterium]